LDGWPVYGPSLRYAEHSRAKIQTHDVRSRSCEGERNVSRSAAKIEDALPASGLDELNESPLPKPMQAKTLQVIDKVVAGRHHSEEIVDLGGSFFAPRIVLARHRTAMLPRVVIGFQQGGVAAWRHRACFKIPWSDVFAEHAEGRGLLMGDGKGTVRNPDTVDSNAELLYRRYATKFTDI
jgi:hypothetical protein